jgi:hypothetical protein
VRSSSSRWRCGVPGEGERLVVEAVDVTVERAAQVGVFALGLVQLLDGLVEVGAGLFDRALAAGRVAGGEESGQGAGIMAWRREGR